MEKLTIGDLRAAVRAIGADEAVLKTFDCYGDATVIEPGDLVYAPRNVACFWWSRGWLREIAEDAADGAEVTEESLSDLASYVEAAISDALDSEVSVYDAVFELARRYFHGGLDDN